MLIVMWTASFATAKMDLGSSSRMSASIVARPARPIELGRVRRRGPAPPDSGQRAEA
jgi:hypothetical protein